MKLGDTTFMFGLGLIVDNNPVEIDDITNKK